MSFSDDLKVSGDLAKAPPISRYGSGPPKSSDPGRIRGGISRRQRTMGGGPAGVIGGPGRPRGAITDMGEAPGITDRSFYNNRGSAPRSRFAPGDEGVFGTLRGASRNTMSRGRGFDPERETEQMLQRDWQRLRDEGFPVLDSLLDSVNDTSIADAAKKDAGSRLANTQERVDRSMGRRTTQMSPAQKKMLQDKMQSQVSAGNSATVNNASIQQRDVNNAKLSQILATTSALRNDSGSTLSNVAGQQIQRDQANSQARAQSRSGFGSMLGTLAGGAIGFMAGGPLGASAGAGIGGSIGGGI